MEENKETEEHAEERPAWKQEGKRLILRPCAVGTLAVEFGRRLRSP